MIKPKDLRTWLEIDRRAIAKNYRLFRSLIPKGTKLMGVVKSNAYGHYLVDFSKALQKLGVDWLGVDSIVEGVELRRRGVRLPILVLGHTLPENFSEAARRNISLSVSTLSQLRSLQNRRKLLPKIHVKVDTGMHRQGFMLHEMPRVLSLLRMYPRIRVEGLFTHFAGAKGKRNKTYTKGQIREFKKWILALRNGGNSPIIHAAASGGTLLFPESHFDMVRLGIALYGIYPSDEIEKKLGEKIRLAPALSWRTVISEIKKLPKGSRIGYEGTEILKRPSVVAVCPVGYWHGFPRVLSGIGEALIRGKRAKVLGRVSMDMISIDVTGIRGVKPNDTVTLIGTDGSERLRAEDIARSMGASPYELLTRLNPLIKRFLT